jgi:hypothetical protein
MKNIVSAVGAIALGALLASSTALAFCVEEKSFTPNSGGTDEVFCDDEGDSGSNLVDLISGDDYLYRISADGAEEAAGGALLDSTASVIIGDDGPCNESFEVEGSGNALFFCINARKAVQRIRVFVE